MDDVAHADVADDAVHHVLKVRLHVGALAEAHSRPALAVLQPRFLDYADLPFQAQLEMGVEQRGAARQATHPHRARLHRQFFVEGLPAVPVKSAHRGAGRPDQLNRAGLDIDRGHRGPRADQRQTIAGNHLRRRRGAGIRHVLSSWNAKPRDCGAWFA
ncbi:hypothetical protein QR66_02415 [Chromobacterium piscinae]|nr:hypothetical protein QR66_02415 [Chromobacterium piscinae]